MKKLLAVALAAIMLLALVPMNVFAATEGTCGDNITWSFDESTGTLTLSGEGIIVSSSGPDEENHAPWQEHCELITNVIIEEGITEIGAYRFYACNNLESITIPTSLTYFGYSAFDGCTNLKEIHISDLTAWFGIEYYDFYSYVFFPETALYLNGERITDLVIPEGVTEIKEYTFMNCSTIESVTIPSSVTTIEWDVFANSESLKSVYYLSDLNAWCNIKFRSNPLSNGADLYVNGEKVTDLVIPEGTTSIASEVFSGCTSLTSVTFPASIAKISYDAFGSCENLKSVYITDISSWCEVYFADEASNPLYNGADLYVDGEKVTDLVIPESTAYINNYAFAGCSGITSVTVPQSVKSISSNAFSECENLKIFNAVDLGAWCEINFTSGGIFENGAELYTNGEKVTDLVIPEGATSIGTNTFSGCVQLTNVVIPDTVSLIGQNAFKNCTNLTEIVLPETVTSVGDYAFYNCSNLASINLPDVTTLGTRVFYNCSSLTSIDIPENITEITSSMFEGCTALSAINIPISVTSVGSYAFYNCSNLATVKYPGTQDDWNAISIDSSYNSSLTEAYNNSICEHSYGEEITVPLTCFQNGKTYSVCANCGVEKTTDIVFSASAHVWSDIFDIECDVEGCGFIRDPIVTFELSYDKTYYSVSVDDPYVTEAVLPEEYNGLPVGSISSLNCPNLVKLSVPNSIISISEDLDFADYPKLEYNEYGNALYLGNADNPYVILVKAKSQDITSCTIHKDAVLIAGRAFRSCIALETVDFEEYEDGKGVIRIGPYAFINCESLKSIVIPDSVIWLGIGAFGGCTSLESAVIGDSVRELEGSVVKQTPTFSGCTNLKEVKIGASVTSIGAYCFEDCESLESIVIPINVTNMSVCVFYNCTNLKDIYCEVESEPESWNPYPDFDHWDDDCNATIHWGYKEVTFIRGDINGSGEIKANDYLILKRYLLGAYTFDDESALERCDINKDGAVKTTDYLLLKRYLLGNYEIVQ